MTLSVLASLACGVVGSYVVVKRMASISGGLSHAAFGGIGLGYLLGFDMQAQPKAMSGRGGLKELQANAGVVSAGGMWQSWQVVFEPWWE